LTSLWEVKCRRGAWRGSIYILAPSEWEAGKQTEIALEQLDLNADVVEVNQMPGVSSRDIQKTSTPGDLKCILCDEPVGDEPLQRRTVLGARKKVPLFGWVRILGEVRTRICANCGKPEQWQINFGYIPEGWFADQPRVLPFVGKTLKKNKEVNVT
jgi:hypothetical protein